MDSSEQALLCLVCFSLSVISVIFRDTFKINFISET